MCCCAASAGAIIGITIGAVVTAAVLAGAAVAAYKKLAARHQDNTEQLIRYNNTAFNADSDSPSGGPCASTGCEGVADNQSHASVAVTIPTAAVAVAAAHAADKPKPYTPILVAPPPAVAADKSKPITPTHTAPAAVAAARAPSLGKATHAVATASQVPLVASQDEGMAIGFTGEELASALRNVQHAVGQKLIFCVEDSPMAEAGEH
jgi:hypothetical protein